MSAINKTEIARLWPDGDVEYIAQQLQSLDTRPAHELTKAALDVFMAIGRPAGMLPAFHDMRPDDILFSNSGVHVSVGDVRLLQRLLVAIGVEPKDRLTKLMQGMPTAGSAQ